MFCESVRWRGRLPFLIIYFKKLNGNKERSMPGGRTPRAFRGRDGESVCASESKKGKEGKLEELGTAAATLQTHNAQLASVLSFKGSLDRAKEPEPRAPSAAGNLLASIHNRCRRRAPWADSLGDQRHQQQAEAPATARLGLGSGQRL